MFKYIENSKFVSSHKMGSVETTIRKMREVFGKEQFNLPEDLASGKITPEQTDMKVRVEWTLENAETGNALCFWDWKEPDKFNIDIDETLTFSMFWEDRRDMEAAEELLDSKVDFLVRFYW